MNRVPVTSSNLASVGYDHLSQVLEVEFHNGGVYEYLDVPAAVHEGLMGAESHGRYFDRHIKKAGFRFRKIR